MNNQFTLQAAELLLKYLPLLWAILLVDGIARSGMILHNLSTSRGIDRITWLITLIFCPLIGTFAYIFIPRGENSVSIEKGTGLKEPSPESLKWAQAVLDKELKR